MPQNGTIKFKLEMNKEDMIRDVLGDVYAALLEKGYSPSIQLVGYIISGDPTYITSYNNARSKITRFERDELLEVVINTYLREHCGIGEPSGKNTRN